MTDSQTSSESRTPEVPIMTVWPTIGALRAGRFVGLMSGARLGFGFFTLGKLLALATLPISVAVFFWQLLPWVCRRYALTSRRIIIQMGLSAAEGPSVDFQEFDDIAVDFLPGQEWLHAGDVVFRRGGTEVLRLSGVYRPQVFRLLCLKAQMALLSAEEVRRQQTTAAV